MERGAQLDEGMVQQGSAIHNSQITTLEMIWELDGAQGALAQARRVGPVLEAMLGVPGLEPVRYDLNQHLNWRAFDVEKALVDTLTQRTQLVRIEGEADGVGCLLATGKHGEVPTAMFALPGSVGVEALVEGWARLFERTEVQRAVVTWEGWREERRAAGEGAPGSALAWRGARPTGWEAPAGYEERVLGGAGWRGAVFTRQF